MKAKLKSPDAAEDGGDFQRIRHAFLRLPATSIW
jgi:hypothetical protein